MPNSSGPRAGLSEMQRAIGRIEGKMDAFIEQMKVHDDRTTRLEADQNERAGKVEGRVGKLERWQGFYAGVGTIIGVILGALGIHFRSGVG